MKEFGGWQFPSDETHLIDWMKKTNQIVHGRYAYQYGKLDFALSQVSKFRRAVDVGSHIGLWAFYLARRFQRLDAFEPVAEHRECWMQNVDGCADMANLHSCALGDHDGNVRMETAPTSSGDTRVGGEGEIPLRRLDDVLPDACDVDFIKLDCEGYELFALRGGEQLIRRNMPVICVEQKPGKAQAFGLGETDAVEYLKGLGYRVAREMSGDYIMVPA